MIKLVQLQDKEEEEAKRESVSCKLSEHFLAPNCPKYVFESFIELWRLVLVVRFGGCGLCRGREEASLEIFTTESPRLFANGVVQNRCASALAARYS